MPGERSELLNCEPREIEMFLTRMNTALLSRLKNWLWDHADDRSLLELDDRQLRDIGLTRDQALAAPQGMETSAAGDTTTLPADAHPDRPWIPIIAIAAGLSLMVTPLRGAAGA